MKKRTKIVIYILIFIITFIISVLIRINLLGSAPMKLIKVKWDDKTGTIYKDLSYENENNNKYDLYIPSNLDKEKEQYLIVYIHGGSFNSGSKEDGDLWCKYYATKGYITATIDYTLQNQGKDASITLMNNEIENSIKAIKEYLDNLGYNVVGMASSGVSAGGTLAMNLAYNGNSSIPVKFVFQLAGPTFFEPSEWGLLKKVDKLDTDEEFYEMMTGLPFEKDLSQEEINKISPSALVNENTVPSLIGYGLKDHCVPLSQKYYLLEAYKKYNVVYDYIEFPKSNHGMYNDLDKMQEFINKSLEYCEKYFQ
jgi:acetyl esterase/lipase